MSQRELNFVASLGSDHFEFAFFTGADYHARHAQIPVLWIHEIKHDGYRLIVQRDGKVVRHLCFMSLQDFAQADGFLIDRIKRGGLNRPRCVGRTRT